MKVYVDDILIKSNTTDVFLSDIQEIVGILRESKIMLNPKKCIFGIISKKFLGYLISRQGIEPNLDKVRAIQEMAASANFHEIQRLTRQLTALSWLLSRSVQKELLFLQDFEEGRQILLDEERQQVFDQMKNYLHHLLTPNEKSTTTENLKLEKKKH